MSSSSKRRLALITPVLATGLAAGVITGSSAAAATDGVPDRWKALVQCESGGDPDAVNPSSGAAGLYQILGSTWTAHGGEEFAPTADQASSSEQLVVAERILDSQGPGAWVCDGAPGSSTSVTPEPEPQREAEPQPEPDSEPAAANGATYEVRKGDTLSQVAEDHGTTWQHLWSMPQPDLGESPHLIYPGDKVNVEGHSHG